MRDASTNGSDSPLDRLRAAFSYAFTRVGPGDPVPAPPPELQEWGQTTALGACAGMAAFGLRQAARNRQEGAYSVPAAGLSKAQVARLLAEENTRRLLRVGHETLRGGLGAGAAVGLYFGVKLLSGVARDAPGALQDHLAAALATGAACGLLVPGARLRCAALGAAAGGALAAPLALAEQRVAEYQARTLAALPAEDPASAADAARAARKPAPGEYFTPSARDGAAAVIAQLEGSLAASPAPVGPPAAEAPAAEAQRPSPARAQRWWGAAP